MELPDAPARAPDQAYPLRVLFLFWMPLTALALFGAGRCLLGPAALRLDGHLTLLSWSWAYLSMLGWLISSARGSGLSLAQTLGPKPRREWLSEAGFVAWLHLQLNAVLFLLLLSALHQWLPQIAQRMGDAGAKGLSGGHLPLWSQWLLIVGLAPITEEWLFRGVLYHRFARRFGNPRAQLLTAALFGLLHMNPLGVFALGLLLQALLRRTRSLATCMLAHAINNAVPLAFITWGGAGGAGGTDNAMRASGLDHIASAWPAWALLSVALTGLLVWHLRRRWPSRDEPTPWSIALETATPTVVQSFE